jgi:acetyl-CoA C-acetyltransferase
MPSVILGAARTPFTKLGGGLQSVTAVELGQTASRAALERAGVLPEQVEYVIFGQVIQAGAGHIPSRQVSLGVGIPEHVGSDTINKVCASGLRAVALADQAIRAGDRQVILAGGMESMSNAPYLLRKARFGYRFGDDTLVDSMLEDALRDPWSRKQMYEQASEVASELGIHRTDLDRWALRSHERAIAAIDAGRFAEEIVPVEVTERRKTTLVELDEGPRADTTLEALAALRPLVPEHPTHTAGNSPGVTDGAAALVVVDEEWAAAQGLTPLARIRGVGTSANRHDSLARVPALAAKAALERAGLEVGAVDRFEINEAFASVAFQSSHDLGVDFERVNVDGGAVALGHPVGASGARLLGTLVRQLRAAGGGIGVAAICSGGGQGDAMVLEVLPPATA